MTALEMLELPVGHMYDMNGIMMYMDGIMMYMQYIGGRGYHDLQ